MTEQTENLVIEIPRRIQGDVAEMRADVRELRGGVGNLEPKFAHVELRLAEMSVRRDPRDEMMERVMRRLDLSDATH